MTTGEQRRLWAVQSCDADARTHAPRQRAPLHGPARSFQPAISVAKDTRVIRPGDMIVTTCTYANPGPAAVLYGQRQNEEMC